MRYQTACRALLAGVFAIVAASMPQKASAQCNEFESRPIELGVAGGNINAFIKHHRFCTSGTLGSMVQDTDGNQFILSNNHVLADINKAKPGELIVQPGLAEVHCQQMPSDAVATFSSAVKLKFGGPINTVDAAIAAVDMGEVSSDILDIGPIASTVVAPSMGLAVQKTGSSTCLTSGTISAVGAHGKINYGGGKVAKFVDQIVINVQNFSGPGDSGSLIVTQDACPQAVGLLFAGAKNGSQTIANPIADVLSGLSVSMTGGCSAVRAEPQAVGQAASATVAENATVAKDLVDSATAVRDRHEDQLMSIPGAVGTGIGFSDQPGHPAIEVYLKKLTPEAQAAAPKEVEGLPVKLIENGGFVAY